MIAIVLLPSPTFVEDAEATSHDVRPGDRMVIGNASCTVSFLFDGQGGKAGEVYFSTAAHCVGSVGQNVQINGINNFAVVEWIHPDWDGQDAEVDMALLRVHDDNLDEVQADVRGHDGSPTGVATLSDTGLGDLVQFSGHGTGFGVHPLTREERVGVLWSDAGNIYQVEAPIVFGDSGGPVLHEPTGKAIGIVSQIVVGCCTGPGAWVQGPNIHHVIDEATDNGFEIELRTV